MKKHIPNLITMGNLFCGLLAVFFVFNNQLNGALIFIAIGAFLDFFDGLTARLLKVDGDLGKQLDSMADMVTFGVAPGFLLLHLVQNLWVDDWSDTSYLNIVAGVAALMIPVFSGLRLAKFNIDTRQQFGFIGLPTPANTLLIGSLVWLILNDKTPVFFQNQWFIIGFSLLSSYLLVSPIPLIALKFKTFAWKGNELRLVFIVLAILLLAVLQIAAIPIIVGLYVVVSILNKALFTKAKL